MKSLKKIISVLFAACIVMSAFSILSFAAETTIFTIDNSLGDQVYKVEFVSNIEIKGKGTVEIKNSKISIYKVPDNSIVSSEYINEKYLFDTAVTDEEGKASIAVVPGTYIVKEANFKYNGTEYEAEYVSLTITEESNYFEVYFKHSVVPEEKTTKVDNDAESPYTGQIIWPSIACVVAIVCSVAAIVVVSKKKKENDKQEENKQEEDKQEL